MSKLEALTEERRAHVDSCKRNNDKSHEIISGLYSSQTHCIYELLQNADDALASEATFTLSLDALKFSHNGEKLFTFQDVKAITEVGTSPKRDDVNSIGKFGTGFKSVFAVTKHPHIYSGDYNFRIDDFIVPESVPNEGNKQNRTTIKLPFDNPDTPGGIYEKMEESIKSLAFESLLFLRNLKIIRWQTESAESAKGSYSLVEPDEVTRRLISTVDGKETQACYFLFRKDVEISCTSLNLSVAYRMVEAAIDPVSDAKLFVFFPTKEKTDLQFLVHAPYKTTPSRETIPLEDDEDNLAITDEVSALVVESILEIKKSGLLNVNFLALLPMDSKNTHPVYRAAFRKIKDLMLKEPLLPTTKQGEYVVATNALLARGKALATLLDSGDCEKIFGRKSWVDTSITFQGETRTLWDYLTKSLDIPALNMENFCSKIDEDFMTGKIDRWLVDFYVAILNTPALYRKVPSKGILRKKPIIRLEDNTHVCPENEQGELQIYLPADNRESKFKTIKHTIITEQTRQFFSDLEIKKPDNVAEIKEFIAAKYRNGDIPILRDEYMRDFVKVFEIWSDADSEYKQSEIIDIIRDIKFIGAVDQNQKFALRNCKSVYEATKKIKTWFQGNDKDEIYFVDDCVMADEKRKKFVKEKVRVLTEPRVLGTNPYLVTNWGHHVKGLHGFNPKFYITGLEFSLNNISLDRSVYLFDLLLKHIPKLGGKVLESSRQNFQDGEEKKEVSRAGKLLRKNHWLYDGNGNLLEKCLAEISLEDLHFDYNKKHDNIEKLEKELGLKLDKIKRLEEETGGKWINREERAEYEAWQAEKRRKVEEKSEWDPEITPENARIRIDPFSYIPTGKDLSGQRARREVGNYYDEQVVNNQETKNEDDSTQDTKRNKEIGKWGEEYAQKYLNKQYPGAEIIWLNESGNVGKGYDFLVKENGDEAFYYEIKSKAGKKPTVFDITGTQWLWATRLHADGKGDMYRILVVSNAGTKSASIMQINNPVARWKAGELDADPVRIKL